MAKRFHDGAYSGMDARRALEKQDAGMIGSGGGAHANMPTEVIMKAYPNPHGYSPEGIDDTIRGIDGQVGSDNSQKHRGMKPTKV